MAKNDKEENRSLISQLFPVTFSQLYVIYWELVPPLTDPSMEPRYCPSFAVNNQQGTSQYHGLTTLKGTSMVPITQWLMVTATKCMRNITRARFKLPTCMTWWMIHLKRRTCQPRSQQCLQAWRPSWKSGCSRSSRVLQKWSSVTSTLISHVRGKTAESHALEYYLNSIYCSRLELKRLSYSAFYCVQCRCRL